MKVFKFGGASVKDAAGVRNVARIIRENAGGPLLVVVSAMGKTTNALERILLLHESGAGYTEEVNKLLLFHNNIIQDLFDDVETQKQSLEKLFHQALKALETKGTYDKKYDAFVSYGEILSSSIIASFLNQEGIATALIHAPDFIVSDESFRDANILWERSAEKILPLRHQLKNKIILTQGFIASTLKHEPTTLGREGSDFSAAIFAYCLDATSVTIWKDVPGIMNADPKRLPAAKVFEQLPYKRAAEMTYYGASVIHPKTIKPLANKKIPLFVKNFDNPELPGTVIHNCHVDEWPPVIVFKDSQCLVSCKVTDYTFVNEEQLSKIFHSLSANGIRINMMQNSAITFSFCTDFIENKLAKLIEDLQNDFEIFYNTGLQLITVKNYDQHTYNEYRNKPGVMLEQSSRSTLQVLVRI